MEKASIDQELHSSKVWLGFAISGKGEWGFEQVFTN